MLPDNITREAGEQQFLFRVRQINIFRLLPFQTGAGQLSTLYTLDQNGNITSQTADTGAAYSWNNNWYLDPASTIAQVVEPIVNLADSWAGIWGSNFSYQREVIEMQTWPPLETCTAQPGCIGPNQAIYNALNDLILRLENPSIRKLADDQVFSKLRNALGSTYSTSSFTNCLRAGAHFYNGLQSTYCYNSLLLLQLAAKTAHGRISLCAITAFVHSSCTVRTKTKRLGQR